MSEKECCKIHNEIPKKSFGDYISLYRPLIVIFLMSVVMALVLSSGWMVPFENLLMGFFLCGLAAQKFFNLPGFVGAFSGYDVVAQKFKVYAQAYPFIEVALGLLYLSGEYGLMTNLFMLTLMIVSNIGVLKIVRSGKSVQCGCAGVGFNLPVGRVTLFENTAMGLMAIANLLHMAV